MELHEGQVVHIVTGRVEVDPGWVSDMDQYFGMEARVDYLHDEEEWEKLDIDDGNFWWSSEMFQEYYDHGPIPDEAEAASIVESLLGEFKRV